MFGGCNSLETFNTGGTTAIKLGLGHRLVTDIDSPQINDN